jgi:uncharacterized membrane protein YidH (DUF202 family)
MAGLILAAVSMKGIYKGSTYAVWGQLDRIIKKKNPYRFWIASLIYLAISVLLIIISLELIMYYSWR